MIREIAKTLPVVFDTLSKDDVSKNCKEALYYPPFEGWYWCKYYSWEDGDYQSFENIFFFDGKQFRTECLCDYDGADWIYELIDIVGGKRFKEYE